MKIMLLLPILGLAIILSSCNEKTTRKEQYPYTFIHTVFFWLNDSVTDAEKLGFEKGLEDLGKVPVIHSYDYGAPAGTERDVVDNSYDYAWIVYFKNAGDQDVYQDHPLHLEFIEKYKHLWKQVKVYDTEIK